MTKSLLSYFSGSAYVRRIGSRSRTQLSKARQEFALTSVIKQDSFSVGRPCGSYGRASLMQSVTQSATSNFSAGHIMPRSAFAIPAPRNPRSARAMQDGVRLALLHLLQQLTDFQCGGRNDLDTA